MTHFCSLDRHCLFFISCKSIFINNTVDFLVKKTDIKIKKLYVNYCIVIKFYFKYLFSF